MKLEVYRDDNIAYLSLEDDVKADSVARTIDVEEAIMIDLDERGRVLGIEFLDAARQLGKLFRTAPEASEFSLWSEGT